MSNNIQNQVKMHTLNRVVIERVNGRNRDIKPELERALGLSRVSINRHLIDNLPNGPLTTVSAVEIISRILDIDPAEVLTEVKQPEPCTA